MNFSYKDIRVGQLYGGRRDVIKIGWSKPGHVTMSTTPSTPLETVFYEDVRNSELGSCTAETFAKWVRKRKKLQRPVNSAWFV